MSDEPQSSQPEEAEQEAGEVQPGSELPRSFAGTGMPRSMNMLQIWGNRQTMNLNPLILENIQQSPYFKNTLMQLKSYQEVIDEIYYNVGHLEPWERGTRKPPTMLGGSRAMEVRGVGAGGVVSTPYCCLYRLFTMKLNRKQLYTLMDHPDSPFIRGLGFIYIRYTQSPDSFWDWYEPYLEDEEEVDPKAGGGDKMTIGQMLRLLMTKLDWYQTLFPRIPVPMQKQIQENIQKYARQKLLEGRMYPPPAAVAVQDAGGHPPDPERRRSRSREREKRDRSPKRRSRSRSGGRNQQQQRDSHQKKPKHQHHRSRSRSRDRRDRDRHQRSRSRDRHGHSKKHKKHHSPSRSKDGHRSKQ